MQKKWQKPVLQTACALAVVSLVSACVTSPTPIDMDTRRANLAEERAQLFRNQEPVKGVISLDEAMARAIKYNLDQRVKLMEEALMQRQLDLSRTDLLPRLVAAAGYSARDNENGSSSEDLVTRKESLTTSTSTDKQRRNGDLSLSWNILDFGVSYFQNKQQADRVLVAQERRRKTTHLIMQQVRQAYWQAAGAQLLENKIAPILKQSQQALSDSRRIEVEKLQSPLETLNYQRQLLDITRQLEAINDELSQAKPRLASLMNLSPGEGFQLEASKGLPLPAMNWSLEKMEETALLRRPELMEARYNERIGVLETRKAIARLFPGVEFAVGMHYDSNSFLAHNQWRDLGLRVNWNLLNLLNFNTITGAAKAQKEIAESQKQALGMAVLAQTHVAYRDYMGRKRQYELNNDMDSVEQRILDFTRNAARNDAQGKLQEIRAAASALMAELRRYQSYGALQGAYGQLLATLGLDPLPEELASHDLAAVQQAVRGMEARWAQELSAGGKP